MLSTPRHLALSVGAVLVASTAVVLVPATVSPSYPSAATAATKHSVTVSVPKTATFAKHTFTVRFSPRKPTVIRLQQWSTSKRAYVTVKNVNRPAGTSTKVTYKPAKAGRTKLRAVALWGKQRAVTPGKAITWTTKSTGGSTTKNTASTNPTSPTSTGDPASNLGEPAALTACWSYGARDSRCVAAGVAAINLGRKAEGLRSFVLPGTWSSLTPAQQLLAITNDERSARGLRTISGLSSDLDSLAATGAATNSDPVLSGGTAGGRQWFGWASNWAITPGGPLYSTFLWMYDDGIGSGNIDCTASSTGGCWGHRHNILAFGAVDSTTSLLLGAAEATTNYSGWTGLSDATLLVKVAN